VSFINLEARLLSFTILRVFFLLLGVGVGVEYLNDLS